MFLRMYSDVTFLQPTDTPIYYYRAASNIVTGYNIGERSLVPNGSRLFVDLYVDGINPYGTR